MPFDDTSKRTKSEIDILDEMTVTLASPDGWCKDKLWKGKGASESPSIGRHCLYGALNLADHGSASFFGEEHLSFCTRAAANVHRSLVIAVSPIWGRIGLARRAAIIFNNSRRTTHEDILAILGRARRLLRGQQTDRKPQTEKSYGPRA